MLIIPKRKSLDGIIQVPDNFLQIFSIGEDRCTGRIALYADAQRAFKKKVFKVRVRGYLRNIFEQPRPILQTRSQIMSAIANNTSRMQQLATNKHDFFCEAYLDISATIDNRSLREARAGVFNNLVKRDPVYTSQRNIDFEELGTGALVARATFNSDLVYRGTSTAEPSSQAYREKSKNMLFDMCQDPINVSTRFPIRIPQSHYGGVNARSIKSSHKGPSLFTSNIKTGKIDKQFELPTSSFLGDVLTRQTGPPQGSVICETATSLSQLIETPISIPASALNSQTIFFLIELLSSRNIVVYSSIHRIDSGKISSIVTRPPRPVRITAAASRPGTNSVVVSSDARSPGGVRIFRKVINRDPSDKRISTFRLWKTVPASLSPVEIEDRVDNTTSLVLYRAAAVTQSGDDSRQISSAVVYNPSAHNSSRHPIKKTNNNARIVAHNSSDGVVLAVINLPDENLRLQIHALDVTGMKNPRVSTKNARIIVDWEDSGVGKRFETMDTKAVEFRTYAYQVTLKDQYGCKILPSDFTLHKLEYPQDSGITLDITDYSTSVSLPGDIKGLSTTFDITSELAGNYLDTIVKSLKESDAEGSFIDEINQNRSKFSDLLMHSIERIDMNTGHRENLGIHPAGKFTDGPGLRTLRSVTPLQRGKSYRYEIRVAVRPVLSLFEGKNTEEINPETLISFKKDFYKSFLTSRDPLTHSSPSMSKRNFSQDPNLTVDTLFEEGKTNVSTSIDVSFGASSYEISSPYVDSSSNDVRTIGWGVSGNVDLLDHFIVMAAYEGIEAPIATVHSGETQTSYSIVDTSLGGVVGDITYWVIPVLNDYTLGPPSIRVTVNNASNIERIRINENSTKNIATPVVEGSTPLPGMTLSGI